MKFSQNDIQVLRTLAARYREIADSEINLTRKQQWTDLNDLKHSGPPLLLVSPEGAWKEIFSGFPVECKNETARDWEQTLRAAIYQHDMIRDDTAFDPVFRISRKVTNSHYGIPFKQSRSAQADGAYHDDPVLQNLSSDLEKLRFRTSTADREGSVQTFDLAVKTFGDLLEVRYQTSLWWTCGLTSSVIRLLGLENFMLAMYDDPEGLHRLMKFLSGEMMNFIIFFEHEELLEYNAGANYVGSGSLGCTTQLPSRDRPCKGPVKLNQLWGFAESQETVGVSPEMFGEFIYPYQLPLLERFGLNYYGCCEAIDKRWEYIKRTPNLRAVSVAPWSDQAVCAGLLGRNYVYCRKPNPSPVCMGFNETEIQREFQDTCKHAGTLNTAIILKDTHTVENHPERFARWVQIGRRIINS